MVLHPEVLTQRITQSKADFSSTSSKASVSRNDPEETISPTNTLEKAFTDKSTPVIYDQKNKTKQNKTSKNKKNCDWHKSPDWTKFGRCLPILTSVKLIFTGKGTHDAEAQLF